jgi:hypothetical protein
MTKDTRVDDSQYDPPTAGPLATAASNEPVPVVVRAECIAREAHFGQREPYGRGRNYIQHVEAVVALVVTDDEKAVAWLHDVLEDTEVDALELVERGIPARLVRSVQRLSRLDDSVSYRDYVADVQASGDDVAIAVKIADLQEHLHPSCPDRLRPRYAAALIALSGAGGGSQQRTVDAVARCPTSQHEPTIREGESSSSSLPTPPASACECRAGAPGIVCAQHREALLRNPPEALPPSPEVK